MVPTETVVRGIIWNGYASRGAPPSWWAQAKGKHEEAMAGLRQKQEEKRRRFMMEDDGDARK